LVGALVVGPVFGAAVGIGLWRQALPNRSSGARGGTPTVTLGVLVGAVLGSLVSLAGVGLVPEPPIAVPLALGGATALVGGFAEQAVRGPRTAGWALPAGVGAVAATALLWAAQNAQLLGGAGGWMLLTGWTTTA